MMPFESFSGDALANRRADYADMLFRSGDIAAGADLMRQALERAPGWAYGWFRLGEMLEAAGDFDRAVEAFRTSRQNDPQDRVGAALKLQLAGALENPGSMPPAFVEALFDQYAGKFEQSLVGRLSYAAPGLLLDALRDAGFARAAWAADLGCGTGLMGEKLRPLADRLEGYDISAAMLRQAMLKGCYDRLEKVDIAVLRTEAPACDLAVAADVCIYFGALEKLFANIAAMLLPGGLFAFSIELLESDGDFALQPSRRYAHSQAYVETVLEQTGLRLISASEAIIRTDRNAPVTGMIVVARLEPGGLTPTGFRPSRPGDPVLFTKLLGAGPVIR